MLRHHTLTVSYNLKMKKTILIICLTIIFIGCQNSKKDGDKVVDSEIEISSNIVSLNLPLKTRCTLFMTLDYNRQFNGIDSIWNLKSDSEFDLIIKNQNGLARPILISRNSNGVIIDSLELFDEECYIGVDSDYQPWLEIDNNLKITWVDTAYYTSISINDDPSTEKVLEMSGKTDTVISMQVHQVETNGQIIKVDNKKYSALKRALFKTLANITK